MFFYVRSTLHHAYHCVEGRLGRQQHTHLAHSAMHGETRTVTSFFHNMKNEGRLRKQLMQPPSEAPQMRGLSTRAGRHKLR